MKDTRSENILKYDDVVFIRNKRGAAPRLIFGVVEEVAPLSILIQDESGELYRVRYTDRSIQNGRMLNVVIIPERADADGDVIDCSGHAINKGDEVAFMEAPSQGFSTSLVIGEVLSVHADGVTIQAADGRKYMRKPSEIVVVEYHVFSRNKELSGIR